MSKRLIFSAILLFFAGLFAPLASAASAELFDVSASGAKARLNGAKIGQSAVIVRSEAGYSSIVARAKITAVNSDVATLEFFTFADVAQPSMPIPVLLPQNGDLALSEFLYENAILLAPNEALYDSVQEQLRAMGAQLVAPELLAQSLIEQGKSLPSRNDLRNVCAEWALGRVFVAGKKEIFEFDCASLEQISRFDLVFNKIANFMSADEEMVFKSLHDDASAAPASDSAAAAKSANDSQQWLNFYSALAEPNSNYFAYFSKLLGIEFALN